MVTVERDSNDRVLATAGSSEAQTFAFDQRVRPHVAAHTITRYVDQVKAQNSARDTRCASIEILPPARPGLLGYLQDAQQGPDVPGEPRLVDLKVVMRDADADPAPPCEVPSRAQPGLPLMLDPGKGV